MKICRSCRIIPTALQRQAWALRLAFGSCCHHLWDRCTSDKQLLGWEKVLGYTLTSSKWDFFTSFGIMAIQCKLSPPQLTFSFALEHQINRANCSETPWREPETPEITDRSDKCSQEWFSFFPRLTLERSLLCKRSDAFIHCLISLKKTRRLMQRGACFLKLLKGHELLDKKNKTWWAAQSDVWSLCNFYVNNQTPQYEMETK